MHNGAELFRFGPFELDPARGRLTRDGEAVALARRAFEVLAFLVACAGEIISKDALMKAVWRGSVGDNTLDRVIWLLRKTLGTHPFGTPYIEVTKRVGYRFVAPVERVSARPPLDLDALLAPLEALADSRDDLDTLRHDAILRAHKTLDGAVRSQPNSAQARIEMAMACILRFEATRLDTAPDVASLQDGIQYALEACRMDPASGEAWSTLGLGLHRRGHTRPGLNAARKGADLEPDVVRNHVRLGAVSWGDECLTAVRRALHLYPDLALPHWLAGRVFIARRAIDAALDHVRAGCAAQAAQRLRFNHVGLFLMHGLLLMSRGLYDEALEAFNRELTFEEVGQLYGRECVANTYYSIGALHLLCGRRAEAEAAFRQALLRIPGLPMAIVGLRALGVDAPEPNLETNLVDAAMTRAAALSLAGAHDEAARVFTEALSSAPPGPDGWLLVVEPFINASARPAVWSGVFDTLLERA